jgi:hypothetical protein
MYTTLWSIRVKLPTFVKNFLLILTIIILFDSCASSHKTTAVQHPSRHTSAEPKFLDNISINPTSASSGSVHKPLLIKGNHEVPGFYGDDIERCNDLQFKYGILLDAQVETITNERLISFLEEWYGIPYKYGGSGKTGIDCSAFTSLFMDSVYSIDLPRTCRDQYAGVMKIKKRQLTQGDLVFFNTRGGISHVGIFLGNNKFVHASTSNGVMISDLDDLYFKKRYIGSVRVR